MLRTTHSLIGVLTFLLLISAFRGELRAALTGVDAPSLALLIPAPTFAALLTAITSAATSLTLEVGAVILLGLYMIEDGINALPMAGAAGLVAMGGLCCVLLRRPPNRDD